MNATPTPSNQPCSSEHCIREIGEDAARESEEHAGYCEDCGQAMDEVMARDSWLDSTREAVEAAAVIAGWSIGRWHSAESTLSEYTTLRRGEDEDGDALESVEVRVSDHAANSRRLNGHDEIYSIARETRGDDDTLESLINRLNRR